MIHVHVKKQTESEYKTHMHELSFNPIRVLRLIDFNLYLLYITLLKLFSLGIS